MVWPVLAVVGVVVWLLGAALMARGWRQRSWGWQCLGFMGLFIGFCWTVVGLFPGAATNASQLTCVPALALAFAPLAAWRSRGAQRNVDSFRDRF